MAHQLEQMAYVGTTPWHGLGSRLTPKVLPKDIFQIRRPLMSIGACACCVTLAAAASQRPNHNEWPAGKKSCCGWIIQKLTRSGIYFQTQNSPVLLPAQPGSLFQMVWTPPPGSGPTAALCTTSGSRGPDIQVSK